MPQSYTKKLAIIRTISMLVIDCRKDLEKTSVIQDLEIIKYIIWNIKLNQGNKEVFALLNSSSKVNLIFYTYAV